MLDGKIHLKVQPEVSTLDFANALNISGFLVPALASRKVETQMELENGQTFAIAGLVDDRVTEVFSKIPGLGDIPILGKLFSKPVPDQEQDRAAGHGDARNCNAR